jgi:hypothetical protein
MRVRHIHLNRRFFFMLALFACLVVSACSPCSRTLNPGYSHCGSSWVCGEAPASASSEDAATAHSRGNHFRRFSRSGVVDNHPGDERPGDQDADECHNGGLPGFQSFMGYQPQKGATIIVLTNLQTAPDGSGTADDLEKVIQKELFA